MTSTTTANAAATVVDSTEIEKHSEAQQAVIFDKTTEKGAEEGLFRACMDSIRSAHFSANRLRATLVLAGLFTDKKVYREVIALFYVATNTMEKKIIALEKDDGNEICGKLLSLGYRFGPQYEKDLKSLYDDSGDWKLAVENVLAKSTDGAKAYIKAIESMSTDAELAGAAFCLWGALIIGGGAVAMPRVESLCGKEACHLFASVTGPGRGERKANFIKMWDSLVVAVEDDDDDKNDGEKNDKKNSSSSSSLFEQIIAVSKECMQGNNELITSVKRNPWWLKYIISTAVGVTAVGVFYFKQKGTKGGK